MKKILISLTVAFSFACHHNTVSTSSTSGMKGLEQTNWKLVALGALTDSLRGLSRAPFMRLDSGKVKGFGGCNNYFGSYTSENKSIHYSGIASTKMFCVQGADIETALFKALENADSYEISNTRLQLLKGNEVLAGFDEDTQ